MKTDIELMLEQVYGNQLVNDFAARRIARVISNRSKSSSNKKDIEVIIEEFLNLSYPNAQVHARMVTQKIVCKVY